MTREEYAQSLEGLSEEKRDSLLKYYDELQPKSDHLKKLITERDEAKSKLKEIQDKQQTDAEAAAKEQGKYKELYETTQTKLTETEKSLTELTDYKDKYTQVETERRNELIEKLPNDDLKNIGKKFQSLEELKEFVDVSIKNFSNGTTTVDAARSGKGLVIDKNKKFDEYNSAELHDMEKNHYDHYKKLWNERYPRTPIK